MTPKKGGIKKSQNAKEGGSGRAVVGQVRAGLTRWELVGALMGRRTRQGRGEGLDWVEGRDEAKVE